MRWIFMLFIMLSGCGVELVKDRDCPDTIIQQPEFTPDVPDWNPAPPDGPVSWAEIQRVVLEPECMRCHRGDRSFSSEALFRESSALSLVTSGNMPKDRKLTPLGAQFLGAFFSVLVIQTFVDGEVKWVFVDSL